MFLYPLFTCTCIYCKSEYCKFENFHENYIFANSVKRHICDVKPFREGLFSRKFARVKFRENKILAKISKLTVCDFGTYRICEERRLRRASSFKQSQHNVRCMRTQLGGRGRKIWTFVDALMHQFYRGSVLQQSCCKACL